MKIFHWLFGKSKTSRRIAQRPQAAEDYFVGRTTVTTSADVDPEEAEKYAAYKKAMNLKQAGDVPAAVELLVKSCDPPSIYKRALQRAV